MVNWRAVEPAGVLALFMFCLPLSSPTAFEEGGREKPDYLICTLKWVLTVLTFVASVFLLSCCWSYANNNARENAYHDPPTPPNDVILTNKANVLQP